MTNKQKRKKKKKTRAMVSKNQTLKVNLYCADNGTPLNNEKY